MGFNPDKYEMMHFGTKMGGAFTYNGGTRWSMDKYKDSCVDVAGLLKCQHR